MTDKHVEHTFGPELPPSPWRLEGLPAPILDSIVDTVAAFAIIEDKKHRYRQSHFLRAEDQRAYKPVPFSKQLEAMSLTSKDLRQNIFSRKIATFLEFRTLEEVINIHEKLTAETRRYVRYVSFLTGGKVWCDEHNALMQTLPVIENVSDECLRLGYYDVPLPTTLSRIDMVGTAVRGPIPLPVESLRSLHIATPWPLRKEQESPDQANKVATWPFIVMDLCENIKSLDNLQLGLPGLSTCGCSHRDGKRTGYQDLLASLPCSLKAVRLSIPYCSIQPGNLREDQWYGYLYWLTRTKGSFESLTITFNWKMAYLRGPGVSPNEVLESLGVDVETKTKKQFCRPIPREFYYHMTSIFNRVPALKRIHLIYTADIPKRCPEVPYKSVKVYPPGKGHYLPRVLEQMHNDIFPMVQSVLDAVEDGRFLPPMPHGLGADDIQQVMSDFGIADPGYH